MIFEHLCFLSTSLLFWWCVLRPGPGRRRSGWGLLLYLIAADVVNTLLSAFLAFCNRPVYAYYYRRPNPFATSAMSDQVFAGVIMWVFGSLVFLMPAMAITVNLLRSAEGGQRGVKHSLITGPWTA